MLQAIAPAAYGGAETAVLGLVAGLRRHGVAPELAVLADGRCAPFLEAAREVGAPVHILDSAGRRYLRDVRNLRSLLADGCFDLVHTHGYRADILGWWAARSAGRAVVATAHGFTGGSRRNRLNQFLGVQALRRADAVVAVSEALGHTLVSRGVPSSRVHVVPNAWSAPGRPLERSLARRTLGLDPDATIVGWVGRISAEKGPDLAVQAHAEFSGTLAMVGDGPERAVLEGATGRDGRSRIHWLGARPAMWSLLPAFDVLLLSSRSEGTPMILLEAMHAGVPIVATSVGGVPALLDESTAWLARDLAPAAIARAVRAALADQAESARRAARARERLAERYAIDPWVERHIALYHRILAGPSGRPGQN